MSTPRVREAVINALRRYHREGDPATTAGVALTARVSRPTAEKALFELALEGLVVKEPWKKRPTMKCSMPGRAPTVMWRLTFDVNSPDTTWEE